MLPARGRTREWLFVVTICAGSFLLFLVQPMVARMALPRLGGAPAVWNSAMLVYQALLLGGYAYAHLLGRLTPQRQGVVHLGLFLAAATMLPIGLVGMMPSATANAFLWVPWLFITSIGPLFFMVSAQAPLVQRWFAAAGGANPYRLYAASNLGSFAGLIAYPLIVEPLLPLRGQSWLWSGGYVVVLLLTGLCALRLPRAAGAMAVRSASPLPWRRVVHWIALAAIPSGLMLSTSTHLTTDIVAMPLLWVLPLGLYLLSFSVAFAGNRKLTNGIASILPLLLLGGGGTAFVNTSNATIVFAIVGLVLLFAVAVALHGRLYDLRPEPEQLTAFYLAMSAGGVLGGLFCALVAPLVFDWVYEHPILIVAAALALPQRALFVFSDELWSGRFRQPAAFVASIVALTIGLFVPPLYGGLGIAFWLGLVVIWIALIAIGQRIVFATCLFALMLTLGGRTTIEESLWKGTRSRSFFGVYDVVTDARPARMLVHGTTLHGTQSLAPGRAHDALSYYAPRSGVGIALSHLPELYGPHARVGIVGLGAGTVACYARPGQDWRFYEIDPAVERIARNPHFFTFLSGCLPRAPVEIGDARLVLAREPAAGLDVLVVDAFSSDAVPMHLLTREAMAIYRRRLAPSGLLVMHISNRYLDLEPVLTASQAQGWHGAMRHYWVDAAGLARGDSSSFWVAMSPDSAKLAQLIRITGRANWRTLRARPGFAGWTDDYSSILPLITLTGQK